MKITSRQSQIQTIKSDDPRFRIIDGMVVVPRAAIKINSGCPQNFKHLIEQCVQQGWIEPIAHVTERELIFIGLSK